tara:strand:+ start:24486 stop:24773 length:288 start_codon:yes stop_codon:yes gene_type:complete
MEQLLNKIANGFKKAGDGFSHKIFNRDQLTEYKPFKNLSWEYLIVKTKNGGATTKAYYVGTRGNRVTMIDACFYQRTRKAGAKRFNVIQKLVKGE